MTAPGGPDLTVAGHERWLPLGLEGDVDEVVRARVEELIATVATEDRVDEVVAVVAGLERRVRAQAEQLEETGVFTLAAWTLLPAPGVLQPGPVAQLRLMALDPGSTVDTVLESLVAPEGERHGPVDVDDLETAGGRATALRQRPVVGTGAEREVHEQRSVFWLRPAEDALMVLSCYVTDLFAGADVAQPLLELAAGVDLPAS